MKRPDWLLWKLESPENIYSAKCEIAKAQAEAGEKDAAMRTFEAAKETVGAIEDAGSKADALREIAKAQVEAEEACGEHLRSGEGDGRGDRSCWEEGRRAERDRQSPGRGG